MAYITIVPSRRTGLDHSGQSSRCANALWTLAAVERATDHLVEAASDLDEATVHSPSLLAGWTRAHVLTHLARNADGSVNLLRWARTGVEYPMYPSDTDRDADIEEGATRSWRVLVEDLEAARDRFLTAARAMPAEAWSAEVSTPAGETIPAHAIVRARLLEVWAHLADLDTGFRLEDIPEPDAEILLEDITQWLGGRQEVTPVTVTVEFSHRTRTWNLRGTISQPHHVQGPPGETLSWLLGRTDGTELRGTAPDLPAWVNEPT